VFPTQTITHWTKYREHFAKNKIDEDHFVLGIDLGAATSAIAYFDPIRRNVEALDISGGYGKPSAPTAIQFDADGSTDEWIFGEYAILNAGGTGTLLTDFVSTLGENAASIGIKSPVDICATYIKELVATCRAINPKAQIAGIVTTTPDFVSAAAKTAMAAAFRNAGLDAVLIDIVEEREALLAHFLHNENEVQTFGGNVLVLDYGYRGLRGGIYHISHETDIAQVLAECLVAGHDATLGLSELDSLISAMFTQFYCDNLSIAPQRLTVATSAQLFTFTHQHKDMIFQQSQSGPIRLYYNFPYPPFSQQITPQMVDGITKPICRRITAFIQDLLDKLPAHSRTPSDFAVVCTGGGFEMPWAKKHIASLFNANNKQLRFYKNSKLALAEGAGLIAASRLGLVDNAELTITDNHKIPWDVGININDGGNSRFYPIVERSSWLWQKPRTVYVLADFDDLDHSSPQINFYRGSDDGTTDIGSIILTNLPKRPPGTTKLAITITPKTIHSYHITIKDAGFGELFPAQNIEFQHELILNH